MVRHLLEGYLLDERRERTPIFRWVRTAVLLPEERIMPSWTSKDERQYEHIKESSEERGVPVKRAKEIAARTVNKRRRETGRTPNTSTQGTGNPKTPLEDRSRQELYNIAKQRKIGGRSKMNKQQLVEALRGKP